MATPQDYIDALFPQQQPMEALTPLEQFQLWWSQQQQPSIMDPNIQGIVGLSPERYQGQNANSALNNAMDYQTAQMGRMLDIAQFQQDTLNKQAAQSLDEQRFGLQQQEFAQEHGDPTIGAQLIGGMLDPTMVQAAFTDPAAMRKLGEEVATVMGEVSTDGLPKVTPAVWGVVENILMDPQYMAPEQQQMAVEQDAADQAIGDNLTKFASAMGRGQQPSYRNEYVRQTLGGAQDLPMTAQTLGEASRGGNTDKALRALFQEHLNQTLNPSGPSPYNVATTLPATGGQEGRRGNTGTVGMGSPTLGSVANAVGRNAGNLGRLASPALAVQGTILAPWWNATRDLREDIGGAIFGRGNQGVVSNAQRATPAQLKAMSAQNKPKPKPPKNQRKPT